MKSVKQTAKEITEQAQEDMLAKLADPHAVRAMILIGQIVLPPELAEARKKIDELYSLIGKAEDEVEALRVEIAQLKAANYDMLPIVQAVVGKGPLRKNEIPGGVEFDLKAFAEDALALHFPNSNDKEDGE
jgi:hypothetical protein